MENLLNAKQRENIHFVSLYAGGLIFTDCPTIEGRDEIKKIFLLVKVKDDEPIKILNVIDNSYALEDIKKLLNEEVNDDSIEYVIFNVRGQIG